MVLLSVIDDLTTKVVSEVDVRKIANEIDSCRVFNTTLANPSAVQNVFIDGGYSTTAIIIEVYIIKPSIVYGGLGHHWEGKQWWYYYTLC